MPTINIVTAVVAGKHDHIGETYASLCAQTMPEGWYWRWIVQEDGETGIPQAELPEDDPRIVRGMGRFGRAPMARTVALAQADGVLTRAVDADDVLPPHALAQDIRVLSENPDIGWVASPTMRMDTGQLIPGRWSPGPGRIEPGALWRGEQVGRLPVHGTAVCAYTTLIEALGGWVAVPGSEDVQLLLALEAVAPGYMAEEVGLYYRKWGAATTSEQSWWDLAQHRAWELLLSRRVQALHRTGWSWHLAAA